MKKIVLKLLVAIVALLIGTGSLYWFFFPVSSNSPEMQVYGERIKIIVTGRVLDTAGRAIRGAKVHAGLGLDSDGPSVDTDADGRFKVEAGTYVWFKVCRPNVQAYAGNFERKIIFFDCSNWDEGERRFEQTVVLEPSADNKLR